MYTVLQLVFNVLNYYEFRAGTSQRSIYTVSYCICWHLSSTIKFFHLYMGVLQNIALVYV